MTDETDTVESINLFLAEENKMQRKLLFHGDINRK